MRDGLGVIENGEVYVLIVVSNVIWGRDLDIVICDHESNYKEPILNEFKHS